jgi:hypothetical protein
MLMVSHHMGFAREFFDAPRGARKRRFERAVMDAG